VRVLVTGATGFVAGHLVPQLIAAGHEVFAAGHDASRVGRLAGAHPLVWDLRGPSLPEALPLQLDAIVHLAQANVPFPAGVDDMFAVHVAGTQRLLELARRTGVRRFVFTSSGSVYGSSAQPLKEDDPTEGAGYYAASKVAAERLTRAYGELVPHTIFRLFTPYGPGQINRLVPGLINRVVNGAPVTVAGGTGPTFNPLFVTHVSWAIIQALGASVNQLLNLGGDQALSVREMAETIGRLVGREPVIQDQPGTPDRIVGDLTELRRHYSLPERLTSFEDGVRAMLSQ